MTPAPGTPAEGSANDIVVTRVFDAPRELVWKAWNDPVAMERWWGPDGFTGHSCTIDLRVGGRYHFCMRTPDGRDLWNTGRYTEVVPPARLVYTQSNADAQGNALPAPFPGLPLELTITVTFDDLGGKTRLTLRHSGFPAGDTFGAGKAWGQALEKLAACVAAPQSGAEPSATADRELAATRIFDAPRELVWRMFTEREHVAQWWGPNGFSNTIHEMDVRPGGRWHLTMHGPDGTDYRNEIVYVELAPPGRLVYDHVSTPKFRTTVTLEDAGAGKTRLTMRGVFATAEERDRTIRTFKADEGMRQTLGRLGDYLGTRT